MAPFKFPDKNQAWNFGGVNQKNTPDWNLVYDFHYFWKHFNTVYRAFQQIQGTQDIQILFVIVLMKIKSWPNFFE